MTEIQALELEKTELLAKATHARKPQLLKAFCGLLAIFSVSTAVILFFPSKSRPHDNLAEVYGFEKCFLYAGVFVLVFTLWALIIGRKEHKATIHDLETQIYLLDLKLARLRTQN